MNIVITGASSGLGESIAIRYSFDKKNNLFLIGRDCHRLGEITSRCLKNGAYAEFVSIDVTQEHLMQSYLSNVITIHGIDIIIACAGVSGGTLNNIESASQIKSIMSVNVFGVINTLMPVIPYMIRRGFGHICVIGSMAGLIHLASAPAYSASKACIMRFADSMRSYLRCYGIFVTTVIPGYIDTPMTNANKFPMPFTISSQDAADIVINGIAKKKRYVIFPLIVYCFIRILRFLPSPILDFIISILPGKDSL